MQLTTASLLTLLSDNPLCDIARSKLVSPVMGFVLGVGQKKLAKTYVKEYCKISKTRIKDINNWLLPLYAARLVEDLSDKEKAIINKK